MKKASLDQADISEEREAVYEISTRARITRRSRGARFAV